MKKYAVILYVFLMAIGLTTSPVYCQDTEYYVSKLNDSSFIFDGINLQGKKTEMVALATQLFTDDTNRIRDVTVRFLRFLYSFVTFVMCFGLYCERMN